MKFPKFYTPAETRKYEQKVARCAFEAYGSRLLEEGPIGIRIRAVYPIPKSATKKKKAEMATGAILPTKKPDLDNVKKAILDGLNGVLFKDDAQVVYLEARKVYGDNPRVDVRVIYYDQGEVGTDQQGPTSGGGSEVRVEEH